jgi:hypothetical protein
MCKMAASMLGAAIFFGATALAADLPKEGTFNGTFYGVATIKATPIGKERVLVALENNGMTIGTGLIDHMGWHCLGTVDTTRGMAEWNAYCVGADLSGDQVALDLASDGRYSVEAKSAKFSGKWTTGTGKYTGISGAYSGECLQNAFRPLVEGTGLDSCTVHGDYKLP